MKGTVNYLCFNLALALVASSLHTGYGESMEHEGTCFWVSDDKRNYEGAQQACGDMGGAIVQLNKPETFDVIVNKLAADKQFWVGLQYGYIEKFDQEVFHWETKEKPHKDQWIPDEPNRTGDCVRLTISTSYEEKHTHHLLADNGCENSYNYICQKPYVFGDCHIGQGHQHIINGSTVCPVTSSPADGNIDCAVSCVRNLNCTSFNFNTASSTCTLFQTSYTCGVDLDKQLVATVIERSCNWEV